jgi:hypothetical protein
MDASTPVVGKVVSTYRVTYFGQDVVVWDQVHEWSQRVLADGTRLSFMYTWLSRLVSGWLRAGGFLEEELVTSRILEFMLPAPPLGILDSYYEFVSLCWTTGVSEAELQRFLDLKRVTGGHGTGTVVKRSVTEREVARRALRVVAGKAVVAAKRKRISEQTGFKRIFGAFLDADVAAGPDAWKRFTPADVDYKRCLGRTWTGGAGGQCTSRKVVADGLCASCMKRLPHGRVTGEIPEQKLHEFP